MNYEEIIHQCDENSKLISMISAEEILRLGYSMKLNESSRVLDLCCGYGTHLKLWNKSFGISGIGLDWCEEFINEGQQILSAEGIDRIQLIRQDVMSYATDEKFDVVILSETFGSITDTLQLGEKFKIEGGILIYCKLYSKVQNPPQELIDFDGEVLPMSELNQIFRSRGYYITQLASDKNADWERYITWCGRRDMVRLRQNPEDAKLKEWIDKWYDMYFLYRREFEGQALFGLEKLQLI
jgi:cyclopropane fatty-acyl-phospholipid synthase-like methyltransferase